MFIETGLIDKIQVSDSDFVKFFGDYAEEALGAARLYPRLSLPRLIDVHGAWCNDLKRVSTYEPHIEDGLDHFKRAGHLGFWIRRFSPVIETTDTTQNLGDAEGYNLLPQEEKFRELLFGYTNEYLAFDIGFQFCRFYELNKEGGSTRAENLVPTEDYIGMVCHFLKYKTVSPHALAMIFKSLFHG